MIIIVAVVLVGLLGSIAFMRYMVNQSKMRLLEQAKERHKKIADLSQAEDDLSKIHNKIKDNKDNVVEDQIEMQG
jgi:uncharacterized membrane protein (DUF106 family)